MLKKQKGFSLIELLIISAFIGIFTAITIGFSLRNRDRWALRDMAREITSTYYQAKQRASRENASLRLDIGAKGYTLYQANGEILKNVHFCEKITATSVANFLISSMGFILNVDNTMSNTRTITLESPRGASKDIMTITIYPYGGLHVKKDFK